MANFRDQSRQNWEGDPTTERIDSGSLQRIADACELMAKDRSKLISDLENAERWKKQYYERWEKAERKISALKGVITKLKKKDPPPGT